MDGNGGTGHQLTCEDKVIEKLAADYAAMSRGNLAVHHGDLVETVITLEEQLNTFTQMIQLIEKDSSSMCSSVLPEITAQYRSLQPTFNQIDRLQELVDRVQADMDALESQLLVAEEGATKGTLKGVLRSQLSLFSWQDKQATEVPKDNKFEQIEIFRTENFFQSK